MQQKLKEEDEARKKAAQKKNDEAEKKEEVEKEAAARAAIGALLTKRVLALTAERGLGFSAEGRGLLVQPGGTALAVGGLILHVRLPAPARALWIPCLASHTELHALVTKACAAEMLAAISTDQ